MSDVTSWPWGTCPSRDVEQRVSPDTPVCPECGKDILVFRDTFTSPFEQYKDRIGDAFIFTGVIKTGSTHPEELDIEVGPLYQIRFRDGTVIDAWPEEVIYGYPTTRHLT